MDEGASKQVNPERIRRAVLEVLAARHPAAFPIEGIGRRVREDDLLDKRPTAEELESAVAFLQGLELVTSATDDFGSTKYYSATSKGVLAFERGEI